MAFIGWCYALLRLFGRCVGASHRDTNVVYF